MRYFVRTVGAHFRSGRTLYILTVLGVALGVASVLTIQIINQSALAAFGASVEAVSGDTDFSVRGRLPTIPESLYVTVLAEPEVATARPIFRTDVALADTSRIYLDVIGVDFFASPRVAWAGPPADAAVSFRLNLTALSFISLLVGFFLVYTSVQAALVRRRAEFGLLRSMGATRRQVLGLILGEAGLLGALGVCASASPWGIGPLKPGDVLELYGPAGILSFPIAGVYYDYATERGAAILDIATFEARFGPGPVSGVALYLDSATQTEAVIDDVKSRFARAPSGDDPRDRRERDHADAPRIRSGTHIGARALPRSRGEPRPDLAHLCVHGPRDGRFRARYRPRNGSRPRDRADPRHQSGLFRVDHPILLARAGGCAAVHCHPARRHGGESVSCIPCGSNASGGVGAR